ncbi:PAPA-1-like conserved region-domain-containing protein [Amylocarpus encephaloides]|uniref:PAPA-1-like conserved region-domain-containing protein n=1 Tax=Amylocarpus encephaloides TaxID=45428 RepID=A0A9P8C0E5_9HELO|nr:PAPA-1-like conserved region-domain-containing protein [Amylocarpus encephaloides]
MPARRSQRSAAVKAKEAITDEAYDRGSSRPSRKASEIIPSATVLRGNLTVKLPSSKLREAVRSSPLAQPPTIARKEGLVPGEILEGKRARNVRKSYVMESDSDEDEEMEDVGDEDAEGEDDDDMDAEDDGLGDEDAEGDIEMDILHPPPVIKISRAQIGKQTISAKPQPRQDTKTVEQKEVEAGSDDDDELSELESDIEVEEEEGIQTGNEEDAEGEDEEIEVEDAEGEDEEIDTDDDTPGGGSRASTPDLTKLTKRQRAALDEGGSGHLLALPDEVQTKKHLTVEEQSLRRAEMARRRKNLSEKRNEEEKMETINKLLKKQAPKTNARRKDFSGITGEATPEGEAPKANAMFVRWVSNKDGMRIGVPEEWLGAPIGGMFQNSVKPSGNMSGKLIEEVS